VDWLPHKASPASIANQLLFTDVDDELLAMGLMTFNTDWKAIQHRYLPTKSMHQIFGRQKNCRSVTTPKNSMKAMRRMKSSPLIAEEKSCIQEGTTLCGIFPEIQQAWSTVPETLFVWPFDE